MPNAKRAKQQQAEETTGMDLVSVALTNLHAREGSEAASVAAQEMILAAATMLSDLTDIDFTLAVLRRVGTVLRRKKA